MNQDDVDNGTRLVQLSNNFISADKVKQGVKIAMGVEERCLLELMNEEVIPVLLLVNKEDYLKRRNEASRP